MSANNKTYQPAHITSVEAQEAIPANRFVSHTGGLCTAETKSLGVSEIEWDSGDVASVVTLGIMPVECSATISAGDNVTSDADGKAKPASDTMPVNGRALDGGDADDFIRINLVP